jgi:hypothetical protein
MFAMKDDTGYTTYVGMSNGSQVIPYYYRLDPNDLEKAIREYYNRIYGKAIYGNIPTYVNRYATGGLADFTGPAWLDGTRSNPELVLNQTDTANFIELKNVLSEIIKNGSISSGMGNNYYDIDVHVDSIDSDYDVDSAANRIKELIVDDAMYRNVNAVQQIR